MLQRIKNFVTRERGTATLEFCIVFPIIIILFVAAFESAMILTRQVMLERSLDHSVRLLRLTTNENVSGADIRAHMCSNTLVLRNCEDVLVVDLREVDQSTYDLPGDDTLCTDRSGVRVNPLNEYDPHRGDGIENELMLIRVCAQVSTFVPLVGFGLTLTRDDLGQLHMVSSSIFVNEPSGGGASQGAGT